MGRMSIKGSIDGASVAGVGNMASTGLHTTLKPTAVGALGSYRVAPLSGAVAAGAGAASEIFAFRWAPSTTSYLAIVTKVALTGMYATTAFAAGGIDITATIARGYTARVSAGTALTATTNNYKMRTSFATTAGAQIDIADDSVLTSGTETFDAQAFGRLTTHSGSVGSATPVIGSIYLPNNGVLFEANVANGDHPLVLANEEGFVIRATVPATGVWVFGVEVAWSEVSVY